MVRVFELCSPNGSQVGSAYEFFMAGCSRGAPRFLRRTDLCLSKTKVKVTRRLGPGVNCGVRMREFITSPDPLGLCLSDWDC